ncbi:hypothetical protein RXV86_19185 [Alisedimentitalea sp. MJ-SS2]|uniref:response regulator transcription factor n=1 Tax=Aliisedimentitalea sp. MJ-SS2 TaxID=3049795 RepID=UPI0029105B62|nr:hypothetical protein [Alisedimentitalea sp. MJ-SS2]MDU8929519.1 hypothetical protein [Alisedimentitalea sp. MJ-SS2]
MKTLIVESTQELGELWQRHLERQGIETCLCQGQTDAVVALQKSDFDILVVDIVLEDGSAMAVADFASYRQPDAKVIFVTNTTFFSDGSIFRHCPNACAFLQSDTPPEDLAAMAHHYGSSHNCPSS